MSASKVDDVIAEGTNEEETVTSEVSSDAEDDSSLGDVDVVVEAKPSKASKSSSSASPEEKEALANLKKEALAFKKAELAEQKKIEAEQKKALAKAEAEQKKQILAEQKKAEAEQKKALAKAEAEQKKLALAEQKKVEAEQKKLALAEQKKAVTEKKAPEKKVLAKQKNTKTDDDDRPSPAFVDPPVAEEADVVKKIMFEGKKYLKSKNTGIIYNMEQDVIGKWNEEKNRIDFNVADEESEDEYDEDDN
jgi:multidrug efflux pump subunit AcrA (membrane-fusion protein)